ncbi:MAG: hypothetical protein ACFCVE_16045 [Phycisphaerae bacterium]
MIKPSLTAVLVAAALTLGCDSETDSYETDTPVQPESTTSDGVQDAIDEGKQKAGELADDAREKSDAAAAAAKQKTAEVVEQAQEQAEQAGEKVNEAVDAGKKEAEQIGAAAGDLMRRASQKAESAIEGGTPATQPAETQTPDPLTK